MSQKPKIYIYTWDLRKMGHIYGYFYRTYLKIRALFKMSILLEIHISFFPYIYVLIGHARAEAKV